MDSELLHGFYLNGVWIAPLEGAVSRSGASSHLAPAAMEVLLHLASEPERIVARETLRARVWGDGADGEERLKLAIGEIRAALGDDPDRPNFIETVARQGYRLIPRPDTAAGRQHADQRGDGHAGAESPGANSTNSLFDSLKRRGVLETAVAYLVVGWLLIQVADVVVDQLHLPDWAGTFVTALIIAGFPIALVLSWFLEFRDGRAVLDTRAAGNARRRWFSPTYLSVIGAMTLAAAGVFVYDRQESTIARVSVAGDGTQGNNTSYAPSVSADGRFVAFSSYASNLVAGDTNGTYDVFVYDRQDAAANASASRRL